MTSNQRLLMVCHVVIEVMSLSVQCNALHGTEYKITCGVCLPVCARVWGSNISKTVRDRGSDTIDNQ